MLALEHYRSRVLCPCGCGWPADVSQDPTTENTVRVGAPTRCHIRTALIEAQRDGPDRRTPEALLWGATVAQEQKSRISSSSM